jgi:serine/threonine protein kinase
LFSYLNLPAHPNVLPFLGLCTDWRSLPETTLAATGDAAANSSASGWKDHGTTQQQQHVRSRSASASSSSSASSGAASTGGGSERTLCLVTEMQQCSLRELALSLPPWRSGMSSSDPRDPLLLLQLVRQMASGLAHFHSCRHIHRDIALRNFLLSGWNTVLLCDFGLARLLEPAAASSAKQAAGSGDGNNGANGHASSASVHRDERESDPSSSSSSLPLRWLAPESLLSHRFSLASDCWSFGVACWELVRQHRALPHPYARVNNMREVVALVCTGEIALHFRDEDEQDDEADDDGAEEEQRDSDSDSDDDSDGDSASSTSAAIRAAAKASTGSSCSAPLAALLQRCLSVTPSKRPTMAAVMAGVDKLIAEWYPEAMTTLMPSAAAVEAEEHSPMAAETNGSQLPAHSLPLNPPPFSASVSRGLASAAAGAATISPHAASAPPSSAPAAAAAVPV